MPVSVLSGLVDEQDVLSNEKVVDMAEDIKNLEDDQSQFTTMLMQVASRPAINPKVEWLEDQLFPRLTTLAVSAATGAVTGSTSLTVATGTGDYFRAYDLYRIPATGEGGIVNSVSTDVLTVLRNISASNPTSASAASGLQIVVIGNAAAEGATLGVRKITKKVAGYNYCQIFRHPFGFTETYAHTKLYGGDQPGLEAAKKAVEHKRAIEMSLFQGIRGIDVAGSQPRRYMGGAQEYISTYVKNIGTDNSGTLTKAFLDAYLEDGLFRGSKNKVLFAAPRVARAISGFLRDAWNPTSVDERVFGAKVDAFISGAYGSRVPVVVKREWGEFATTSNQWGGWAYLIDMDAVRLRPLRNTALLRNRQANDADEVTHEYLTETSFEFSQEPKHMILKGTTA